MNIGYFDGNAGISGDMILGAFIDAGIKPGDMEHELKKLKIRGWAFSIKKVRRAGWPAVRADVRILKSAPAVDTLKKAVQLIQKSSLEESVKEKSIRIFKRLALAEARAHGHSVSRIKFHELGSLDTVIDIVGAAAGAVLLNLGRIFSSPLNVGSGTVEFSHGTFPVPAPAVIELLKKIPVYSAGPSCELVTPTGAAIIAELAEFSQRPVMSIEKTGYGAGSRDLHDWPNRLRLSVGRPFSETPGDIISIIEVNIDDSNPQIFGYLMEKLFNAGALDVFTVPIQMKKNRPAILLTVLSKPGQADMFAGIILKESTSFGVRIHEARRCILPRKIINVITQWGICRVKTGYLPDGKMRYSPEYEDVKKIAIKNNISFQKVYDVVTEKAKAGNK